MTAKKKKSAGKKSAGKKSAKDPWKRPAPKGSSHKRLTAGQKRGAKAAAKKAGRRYPNLVDNMRAAKKRKKAG